MAKRTTTSAAQASDKPALSSGEKRLRGYLRSIRTMAKAINPVERDNDAPLQALKGLIQAAESQAAKLNGEGTRS